MKMKEVCARTGLTERAVRFYVQEGLLCPSAQRRGGRTWLDFSEPDVARLRAIATLRRTGFSVEEIRAMSMDFPQNAPLAAFALKKRLQKVIDSCQRLARADPIQAEDLESYAALLERDVRDLPLPPSDRKKTETRLNWPDIIEWTSMAVCTFLMFLLYVRLVDWLILDFDLPALLTNPLTVILAFVVLPLPAALVLGSRLGRWLYQHFEYVS